MGKEKQNATHCYLCNVEFLPDDKIVTDHDHFSGKYLGIAHNNCNLQRKTRPEMVVFFHNANYNFVELFPKFFKDLGVKVVVDGIPKAGERFMALSLGLKVGKEVHQKKSGAKKKVVDFIFTIHFRDSLSFLGASLEKVMESFPVERLINLREFPNEKNFELVRKKLPFPYGYMNDNTKLLSPLPKHCECFDMLSGRLMDDE